MKTAQQIRQERANVINEAKDIRTQIEKAETPDETLIGKFDELMTRAESLEAEARKAENLENRFSALDGFKPDQVEPRSSNPLPQEDAANRNRQFSLFRAIMGTAEGRLDGYEAEVSQEMAKRMGISLSGNKFILPLDVALRSEQRTMTTTDNSGVVQTVIRNQFLDYLTDQLVVKAMGAQVFNGLSGKVVFPHLDTDADAEWVGETVPVPESNPSLAGVTLSPKRLGTFVDFTRELAAESSLGVETFLRNLLGDKLARRIDQSALNGSGVGVVPEGILQNADVPTIAIGTNGGAPTYSTMVNLEATVEAAGGLSGKLGYVLSPSGKAMLRTTSTDAGSGRFIYDAGEILGYPAMASPFIPNDLTKGTGTDLTAVVFGDWSQVLLGFWSGVVVTVDPYTMARQGIIRLVVDQLADVAIANPLKFAKATDVSTV